MWANAARRPGHPARRPRDSAVRMAVGLLRTLVRRLRNRPLRQGRFGETGGGSGPAEIRTKNSWHGVLVRMFCHTGGYGQGLNANNRGFLSGGVRFSAGRFRATANHFKSRAGSAAQSVGQTLRFASPTCFLQRAFYLLPDTECESEKPDARCGWRDGELQCLGRWRDCA